MAFFCARTKYGTDHKNCKSRNKTVHGRSVRGFLSDDNRIKMTINVRCEPPINNMLTSLIIILSLADYCQCFLLLTEVIGGTRLELFQLESIPRQILNLIISQEIYSGYFWGLSWKIFCWGNYPSCNLFGQPSNISKCYATQCQVRDISNSKMSSSGHFPHCTFVTLSHVTFS